MIVLCDKCFPQWAAHEVLTIVPMSSCEQCGHKANMDRGERRCTAFRKDPRSVTTLKKHRFEELADACRQAHEGFDLDSAYAVEIEFILRALAAADEAMPTILQSFHSTRPNGTCGELVLRDDALKAVALASMREVK